METTGVDMPVREGMATQLVTVGPAHTLREAAEIMAEWRVGAAVVLDPDGAGPGIITERDLLRAVAAGADLDQASVADHVTRDAVVGVDRNSLHHAAEAMLRGGFRHLIVVEEGGSVVGMLSMRDVFRCWAGS